MQISDEWRAFLAKTAGTRNRIGLELGTRVRSELTAECAAWMDPCEITEILQLRKDHAR